MLLIQPRLQDADVVYTIAENLGEPVDVIPVGRILDNLPWNLGATVSASTNK